MPFHLHNLRSAPYVAPGNQFFHFGLNLFFSDNVVNFFQLFDGYHSSFLERNRADNLEVSTLVVRFLFFPSPVLLSLVFSIKCRLSMLSVVLNIVD